MGEPRVDVDVDIAVVGGGPVGLATAIHARLAGLSVCVLEKRTPPVDKACGEGLMPAGVQALHAMGVQVPAHARHGLQGIRYIDGPWQADGNFAGGALGWGIRRLALAEALTLRAKELQADVRGDCAVLKWDTHANAVRVHTAHGSLQARWLVGADGLHSRVREAAGLTARTTQGRRFGVRRHFHIAPWSAQVEVHWARGAEAYVTPVAPNAVNIAFLWDGAGHTYDSLLHAFPQLQARVQGVQHASSTRGAGPFAQHVPHRVTGRVALVGDAAGYLDALTGEGITLGLRSSAALVQVLAQQAPLSHYEKAYRRLSADYYRSTHLLLAVARRPWLRRLMIAGLAQVPGVFGRLLAWHGQSAAALPAFQEVRHPSR